MREKERKRETERGGPETDRKTQKETDIVYLSGKRTREIETDRQTQRQRQADRRRDIQTASGDRQTDKEADKHAI